MPPAPRGARISYGPILSPTVRAILEVHYSVEFAVRKGVAPDAAGPLASWPLHLFISFDRSGVCLRRRICFKNHAELRQDPRCPAGKYFPSAVHLSRSTCVRLGKGRHPLSDRQPSGLGYGNSSLGMDRPPVFLLQDRNEFPTR